MDEAPKTTHHLADDGRTGAAPDSGDASRPAVDPRSPSIDHWLPVLAVAAMVGTFIALPTPYAMTLIAAIWLGWTRLLRRPSLLGLTLTQALAWVAGVAIVEFVAVLLLYVAGGVAGG